MFRYCPKRNIHGSSEHSGKGFGFRKSETSANGRFRPPSSHLGLSCRMSAPDSKRTPAIDFRPSGKRGGLAETWAMARAKRARKAETPKQPSLSLMSRAPYFYPTPLSFESLRFYHEFLGIRRVVVVPWQLSLAGSGTWSSGAW